MPVDAEFESTYDTLLKSTDERQVMAIEAYVHDQAGVLFLYSPTTLFAVSERVHLKPYDTFMLELAGTGVNRKSGSRQANRGRPRGAEPPVRGPERLPGSCRQDFLSFPINTKMYISVQKQKTFL